MWLATGRENEGGGVYRFLNQLLIQFAFQLHDFYFVIDLCCDRCTGTASMSDLEYLGSKLSNSSTQGQWQWLMR